MCVTERRRNEKTEKKNEIKVESNERANERKEEEGEGKKKEWDDLSISVPVQLLRRDCSV